MANIWLKRGLVFLTSIVVLFVLIVLIAIPVGQKTVKIYRLLQSGLPNLNGRTNFLVLGIAGDARDGADLTDSIMWFSVNSNGSDIVSISLPRDLWIESLRAKINTAYYYGEQKQPGGGGLVLAKSAASEILGQPVHFAAVIDFSGFEKIIDLLGGVDVEVKHTFEDFKFPVPGKEADPCEACRYETLRFEEGITHMTGQMALKYVRSRNAVGDEGTDFARQARQQQLLKAIQNKILKEKLYLNWQLIEQGQQLLPQVLKFDIKPDQYWPLGLLGFNARNTSLRAASITDLLYNPSLSYKQFMQWVLLPKNNDPKAIYEFVTQELDQK